MWQHELWKLGQVTEAIIHRVDARTRQQHPEQRRAEGNIQNISESVRQIYIYSNTLQIKSCSELTIEYQRIDELLLHCCTTHTLF